MKLDITPIMSSGQQEHKPWRLIEHENRALIRPLSPFSSFIAKVSKSNDKSMTVKDSLKDTKVKKKLQIFIYIGYVKSLQVSV